MKEPQAPNWREPKAVMPEDDKAYACHEFYRSVVNFCYTDPTTPKEKFKVGPWTGSMAMAYCFQREFGNTMITPDDIYRICETKASMEKFFAGDNELPMLLERRGMLAEAATKVKNDYHGNPLNILIAGDYHCYGHGDGRPYRGVVDILIEDFRLSFGADYHDFGGGRVARVVFAKRAQLWPLLYQGRALDGRVLKPLRDAGELGIPADYQVPKTLWHLGILEYEDSLLAKIDRGEAIPAKSPEELGIRLATVAAASKLLEAINVFRPDSEQRWTMVELDYELWSAGRAAKHLPHHLTETTDY